MHRIDTAGSINNRFVERDPGAGVAGTKVGATFMNAIQEEIVSAIEMSGIDLDKADNAQLGTIITKIRSALDQKNVGFLTIDEVRETAGISDGQQATILGRDNTNFKTVQWVSDSTASDDGINIFKTDVDLGRWVVVAHETPKSFFYTQMGKAFSTTDSESSVTDVHAAWVHETVSYDASLDKFVIFYNLNSGHEISENSVLMITKDPEGEFSTPIVIASDIGVTSHKCQAAGIAANGDYLALVAAFDWGSYNSTRTDIYRSSDSGATWSINTMTDADSAELITAYNGDITGFLVLKSGRILTLGVAPAPSYLTRIFYSDDHGLTWHKASISGNPTDVTEPGWCELPDGTIICMARAAVRVGSVSEIIPAKFMTSADGGETWTEPTDSQSITEMTLANGKMLVREDDGVVEFIHHSRYTKDDGYSSLNVSTATFDQAKTDRFPTPTRIGRLAAYKTIGSSSGDSGYVGAATSASGVVNVFYYNGLRNHAQINWAVGRRVSAKEREYAIDHVSGEKISTADGYRSIIYGGLFESYEFAAPIIEGYIEDGGSYRKNEGSVELKTTGVGRGGGTLAGGINVSGIDKFYVHYNASAMDSGCDFGVFLYNKESPESPLDGRVRFLADGKLGNNTIELDVSDLSGVYYPQFIVSNNSTSGSNGNVRVTEIGIISSTIKRGDPVPPGVYRNLYENGNEKPFASSGGWSSGYSAGTGSITNADDRLRIVADGSSGAARRHSKSGAIDLTEVSIIEALVHSAISNNAESDFGLAIFTSAAPSNESDGRVAFRFQKTEGLHRIFLDVRDYSGNHYINVVVNANTQGGAASVNEVNVFQVKTY